MLLSVTLSPTPPKDVISIICGGIGRLPSYPLCRQLKILFAGIVCATENKLRNINLQVNSFLMAE